MAAFNLTAQLNLVGPTNIRQIVGDIRKQLETIKGTINVGIDPQSAKAIAQAQSQAAQLSSGLNNVAKSGNTAAAGMRDLNDAAAKNQLGSTAKNAASAADAATNLGKQSSTAAKDVKVLGNELAEFGRQSGLAIRRFAAFSLVSGVMYKLNSAINQALSQYIDFDRELVRVSQVTGKSVQELGSLVDEISSLAGSTGVASKELIQVSSTLAQAGLSAREAEQALKALALSANAPSFDNLNDTVEGSIALMRQFGIRANELESALGSINAVAAAFAVEASDLITAISRTGGVFASASRGVSEGTQALNEFIAVFTSIRATTRESAETIATGLRTIFTRIQRESTITALKELGVELRDVEGKFVGPYEAVRRLSEGLGQLDPRSQVFANIIEELGGFRQIGKVIPLIQQFATAEEALQVALKGGDSLAEANRQAQQSLAVQLAKTREEFVALVRDFANNSVFRGFLTTTISITKSILSLARAGKSLFPLLTILGGFKAFSAATQFAGGFLQGVRPTGGKAGGSASRGIGQNLGEVISGSTSERQSASLDKIAKVLESNAGNFNTNVSSLIQPITQLSTAIQQNIVSLTDNTGALTANTAAINNLTAALGVKGTTLAGGGKVLGFAKGGTVPGSGRGDKVPALLEPGEVVMSNSAVNKYGRGNLVRMNKYAKGGKISDLIRTRPTLSQVYDTKNNFTTDEFDSDSPSFIGSDEYSNITIKKEKLLVNTDIYRSRADRILEDAINKYIDTNSQEQANSIISKKTQNLFKGLSSATYKDIINGKDRRNIINPIQGALAELSTKRTYERSGQDLRKLPDLYGADFSIGGSDKEFIEVKAKQEKTGDEELIAKALLAHAFMNAQNKSQARTIAEGYAFKNNKAENISGIDILLRSSNIQDKHIGGKIQKFVVGGTVEGIAAEEKKSIETVILEQLSSFGNASGVKKILGLGSGEREIGAILNAGNIKAGKNIAQAIKFINRALAKTGKQDAAREAKEAAMRKVAIAGLFPLDYNKDFSDWKLEDGREIYGYVRGFQSSFLPQIEAMQEANRATRQKFAEDIQDTAALGGLGNRNIQGPIQPLAIDFDETLALGTKMLDENGKEDLPAYSDRKKVMESLAQARPTSLAKRLASIEQKNPGYVRMYSRILTARPQSTADIIASTLNRFGLPYLEQDVTGVSQGLGTNIAKAKAANVARAEKLIDDSEENIRATMAAGKSTFRYGEVPELKGPAEEKFGQSNIEGGMLEAALSQLLGYNINVDTLQRNRAIDFPNGLGRGAQLFGLPPNIETEVKRTLDGDSFSKAREEFSRYFKENPQAFAKGGTATFGSGTFKFPKRISNAYVREMEKLLEQEKMEKVFSTYPGNERMVVDEEAVQKGYESPFSRELFINSFKDKISRNTVFERMGQFARVIGLPQTDFLSAIPTQLDFGVNYPYSARALFSKDPSGQGTRGLQGVDLTPYGYTEQDKQDLFGYTKLIEEKKKQILKTIKTPLTTYEDGSFSYDTALAEQLRVELNDLQKQQRSLIDKNNAATKAAKESRLQSANQSGRGSVGIPTNPFNTRQRQDYNTLYHELTHQLFNSLRTKNAQSFEAYKAKVSSLFDGNNDDVADAFDALVGNTGYNSADVAYGRSYKLSGLNSLIMGSTKKESFAKYVNSDPEYIPELRKTWGVTNSTTNAKAFKPLNPRVNDVLLRGKISQDVIDKYEDNGKEEFLTTLVQKLPLLDENLSGILDSTLNELLRDAGISRQKFALGGLADSKDAMSGLMQGLYGNRRQQTDKKEKDFGKISITEDGDMLSVGYLKNESRSGYVQAMKYKDNLWYVGLSKATKGYGPRLYDVAMEAVSEKGGMLTSDRSMVSSDAQKVWAYYFKNRGDVKKTPLEPENWTKNQSLIDPKLYGRRETWPPPTDPAWILQSGYSKSPTLLNDPEQVKRNNNRAQKPVDSRSMALAYFQRADGGPISHFADGGSVPALVSNGEAYVPPKLAKRIGYGTLGRMNQADKNGMGRFSDGGISVFKGPGSGTSDSIPTSLPVGSFIIRQKATKALGLNKGGSVGIQKFQAGGAPTNNGDLYFTTLSAAQIQDIVGKGSSRTGIDVESLDLLTRYAQDAGMSIEDFSSGLIRARDTAVVSALMQGQSFKEAALAGQQAAIAMADIPNMQVTGENPLDVLRSLTASSTRVQTNVEQRREILSDPEIIAAINETNDLMSKLTPAEQFSVQTGTGPMTPEMEAAAASRRRQKNIVGYKIEERQTQANQPGFVAPTIQQPTNLMDIDGINNQLKEAQNNAALYASSLRDQANAIRAQQEITIDPGTFAGLEAKAQALEAKATAADDAYKDLADSTQAIVLSLNTDYQIAIDSMRTRAESVAKATQDVEKAMVTRAKEIASANPELTAEEIGQQISTEKTGIVAEARAQQTEAETKFGMAQSRVDTLAGKAGAGADILSQEKAAADKARAEAQAKAEADAQLEARKQQARDLGAKRAAIAVPSQREGETEQEFKDRRQKATERFTRQSAQELGLSKTRFVSSRQKKAIEEEEAKKTKVEREKTDVAVQSTDTKATLLLVQAINANTVAQTGSADSVQSLTEQTNGLIATNEQLTNAKNADIEQANASPDDSDLFKDTLREIPFLDKLETLGSAVGDFANNFAASTTDIDGKISKFGSVLQGGAARLESGIKKLASGIRSANEAFLNTKIGKFADSFSQYGTAIGFGVTSVSQYLADMSGGFETTSGTLLQFGATIASQATIIGTFGAQFGPLGGLIGSVAGAAMGLTRAFFDMQNAARERARAELELSKDNAFESATSSFELAIAGSGSSVDDFKAGLSDMVTVINAEKELLQQSEEASLFTRDYMGFGGLREKTGEERNKAIRTQAASQQQGAALAKQFMGGLMSRGNMTLEQVRGQVGEENYKAMGNQIAQADGLYIDATSKAAAERRKGTISEQEYKNKVDEAREASVKRALATQQAAAAEEQYRTSVTEARKRLESSGTAFLKELITSTPKQRTEMRKDFESAGGLLEGDFTKSRAQQEEAAQKAFRETSGTVKEKREAAENAKAQVRESNFQRAEQILSFGDQSSNEIRNARANLYETQLREQGINPNEGMAKMVIDSLRAPDPEVQARERNVKAILSNTDALEALKQEISKEDPYADPYAQAANNENIGRTRRETVATYAVGTGVAIGLGGGMVGRQMYRKNTETQRAKADLEGKRRRGEIGEEDYQDRKRAMESAAAEQPKPQKNKGFLGRLLGGGEVADTPKPTVATDQTPRTPPRRQPNAPKDNVRQPPRRGQPSAEAPQPQAAVPGRKAKVSASAKKGAGGLVAAGIGLFAIGSSFFGGSAQPESDSGAQQPEEDQPIIESSPEIIQLLSAIEANTRECCAGGGTGGEKVTTNTGSMENIPITKEPVVAVEKKTDAIAKEITTATSEPITMMESLNDEFAAFSSRGYQDPEVTKASINTLGSFATDIMGTTDVARTMRSGGIGDTTGQNKFVSKPQGVAGYTTRAMGAYGAVQSLRAFRETGAVDDALGIVAGAGNTAGGRYAGLVGDTASAARNSYRLFSGKSREEATLAQDSLGLVADLGQVGLQASPEIAKYGPQALQTAKNFAPKSIPAPSVSTPVSTPSAAWLQANGYSSDEIAKIVGSGADDTAAAAGKSGGLLSKITKPLQALGKIPGLGTAARLGGGVLGGLGVVMGGVSGYSADTEATGRNKYVNTALGALSGTGTTMGDVGQQSTIGGLLGVEKGSETDQMIGNASSLAAGTLGVAGAIGSAAALGVGAAAAAPALAIGATVAGGALLTQESIGLYNDRSVLAEKEKQTAAMEEDSRRTKLVKNDQGEYVRQAKTAQDFDFGYNLTADESNAVRAFAKNQAESNRAKELASKTSLTQDETSELANIKKSFGMEEGASNQDILAEAQRRSDTAASDLAAKARTRATTTKVGLFGDRYDQLDEKKQTENMQKYLSAAQQYQPETFVQPEEIPAPQTTIVTKEPTAIQKEQKQMFTISAQAPKGTAAVQATSAALQQQQAVPVPETITGQGGQVIPVVGDAGSNAAITRGSSFMAQVEAMDAANRTTEQPSVVSASAIDAAMATQLQPAPAETDNWFKNAQADLTRIQASPDANITGNTQPANGVINTSTTQQQPTAAGMSQLFDTAAIGNTLQTVFGQFVSDLQNIQLPKIPDMVTMEGKHTVEVIINGADVLKSLEPMLQDIIKTKLTEFNNKLNSTTEGGFGA